MNGSIKRLVKERGFGFILSDTGEEYFFHSSTLVGVRYDDLEEGTKVTFSVGSSAKGPRAENVKRP